VNLAGAINESKQHLQEKALMDSLAGFQTGIFLQGD
jgi:hypothetical protein